jgi:hypothetical protein
VNTIKTRILARPPKTCCSLALAITLLSLSASATTFISRSDEEVVASADWIFTGFILRSRSFPSNFIALGVSEYTIQVGLVLRGSIPKTIVVRGFSATPEGPGRTFIFLAQRSDRPVAEVDATLSHDSVRRLKELKEIKRLISTTPLQK